VISDSDMRMSKINVRFMNNVTLINCFSISWAWQWKTLKKGCGTQTYSHLATNHLRGSL